MALIQLRRSLDHQIQSIRNAPASLTGQDAEHRHHGPHRCRQDHYDRTDPVLHRDYVQDRRGARRHRRDGLDGAGAGARHHDHVGRDHLFLAGSPDQHHRHARPRGLHRRSRAVAARARRRRRGLRLGRRRRAAVRDGLAPGRQVSRPANLLRQQDGPRRGGLQADLRSDHHASSKPTRSRFSCRSAPRTRSSGWSTSSG